MQRKTIVFLGIAAMLFLIAAIKQSGFSIENAWPMIEGNNYEVHFSTGDDIEGSLLSSDLPIVDFSRPACHKSEDGIVCPSGAYTATVQAQEQGDAFAYVSLYNSKTSVVLLQRPYPLALLGEVTPFHVRELGRTDDAINFDIEFINLSENEFHLKDAEVSIDGPGDNDFSLDLKDVVVQPGEQAISDPVLMPFSGDGYYIVSVRVNNKSFLPLDGDIKQELPERSVVLLPSLWR